MLERGDKVINQYFILDIDLRRGYNEKSNAFKTIIRLLYPDRYPEKIFEQKYDCTEINDAIEKFIKDKLGKSTADLCLDYFADMFGDGEINTKDTVTFQQLVAKIVEHKATVRKNIGERCE